MSYNTRIYKYVSGIPLSVWSDFSEEKNIYFTKEYLTAFETHNSHNLQFFYIVIFNQNKAVSIAVLQVLEFDITQSNFVTNTNKFVQKIMDFISCLMKRNYVKVMICGSPFLSGEYGILINPTENKEEILTHLVKGIQTILNANKYLKKWVDVILIKDFFTESLPVTNKLKKNNYTSVQVDANMVLNLDENWKTFDDYLANFRSKFRVKAKKAYKQSASLVEKEFNAKEIIAHKEVLTKLYKNVFTKANFNWATLNLSTYAALESSLNENFIFKVYYLEDKMVGFMSGIINQNRLDAHYVGLDYDFNRTHAIYSRMLYDYVKIAIDKKLKHVYFGRTSGEIKSTVGAVPQELTAYLRHKKSIANFFFKPFLRRIKPSPFEQRFPFKKIS